MSDGGCKVEHGRDIGAHIPARHTSDVCQQRQRKPVLVFRGGPGACGQPDPVSEHLRQDIQHGCPPVRQSNLGLQLVLGPRRLWAWRQGNQRARHIVCLFLGSWQSLGLQSPCKRMLHTMGNGGGDHMCSRVTLYALACHKGMEHASSSSAASTRRVPCNCTRASRGWMNTRLGMVWGAFTRVCRKC